MGDKKPWLAVLLGLIFSSPLSIAVTGILFAVVFIASLSFLIYYGLVSALVYGFGAFLLVAFIGLLMGKDNLQSHWRSFIVLVLLVPGAFFFGWFSDRMGSFGLSVIPLAYQQFSLSPNAWGEGEATMVTGSYIIGLVALAIAVFLAALIYLKPKKKRR